MGSAFDVASHVVIRQDRIGERVQHPLQRDAEDIDRLGVHGVVFRLRVAIRPARVAVVDLADREEFFRLAIRDWALYLNRITR